MIQVPAPVRRRYWRAAAEVILLAVLLAFVLVRPFVLEPFYIPSDSMLPLLRPGDRIFVNKLAYRLGEPRRGEVVVFYGSETFGYPGEIYIKRVLGLPGETVAVRRGKTYVQGRPLDEGYLASFPFNYFGPVRVPKEAYFVMGDNRNDSRDSRYWGAVSRESLIGHAVMIFWPPSRLRPIH